MDILKLKQMAGVKQQPEPKQTFSGVYEDTIILEGSVESKLELVKTLIGDTMECATEKEALPYLEKILKIQESLGYSTTKQLIEAAGGRIVPHDGFEKLSWSHNPHESSEDTLKRLGLKKIW